MKSLELKSFGVQELDAREMLTIEGGSWFGRNFQWIGMAAVAVAGAVLYIVKG